jgi:hypothetical protein
VLSNIFRQLSSRWNTLLRQIDKVVTHWNSQVWLFHNPSLLLSTGCPQGAHLNTCCCKWKGIPLQWFLRRHRYCQQGAKIVSRESSQFRLGKVAGNGSMLDDQALLKLLIGWSAQYSRITWFSFLRLCLFLVRITYNDSSKCRP